MPSLLPFSLASPLTNVFPPLCLVQTMNGFELYGRPMKVGWASPAGQGGGGAQGAAGGAQAQAAPSYYGHQS